MSCHGLPGCEHIGHCDNPCHDEVQTKIAQLTADLTQTRLDLLNSNAIRAELVRGTVETAGDMVRVLTLLEAAYHAGFLDEHSANASEGFRTWSKENIK